ncbi:Linear+gramicidin+synthase+subunit+D [Methylocapsa aurea]
MLRTAFVLRDGAATQVIAPRLEIETPIIDLGALDEQMRETEALRLAAEEARRPFDLATGPLLRVKTLDLGVRPATAERERVMLFTMHHIVSDGWSSGVLLREFVALYEARLAGRPSPLPELAIQYADYAVWQRDWLRGEVLDRQLAYWRDKLGGAPPALDLPTDHPRPPRQDHAGARLSFTIAKHVADRLAALGREEGATLFMTLLAAFQLLLSRYSGQRDISVGAPVANRRRLELEQLIGFFVNTLVMRTDLSGDPSFRVLLARVRETALGAQAHQDLPFERLVEDLRPVRDMSRDPLFQVMFSLQNAPKTAAAVSGLRFEPLAAEGTSAKFDLTLSIAETDNGLAASLEYATALFEASTIDRMARHYCALLDGIARDPDRRIGELDILPQDERHRLLVEWNDTATDDPQDRLLHEMFEAQAARDPEAVALVYEGAQLSYGELNERANRLAHHLQTLGVGPDVIVGLCVERSFEMIVALLGVLKAGGAYLPIDPDYPRDRIAYMIADAAPALVLTQEHLRERLPETITTLRLDADWSVIAQESAANLAPRATPQNLAYVIYTSGSTGRPKGVGVSHDAIACRLEWMQERFGLTVDDIVLQKTPYGFDVSVWEFFWPLRQGARMSLAPPGSHRSPEQLMAIIDADLITTLHFVPSMLRAFLDAPKLETLSSLRRVLCGGEALAPDLRDRFIASYAAELHHLYGPTEASIDAAVHRCDPDQSHPLVPIGRPISNTQIYLLGPGSEPVPIGVAGELHIGGAGLARGYLGRPDLTAERFVPNSFGHAGERLYRTGDLARYRADGNIEFLGRIDHQVKIRGFRIELGEIEAALTRLPQLREAVVIASEDGRGDKRLVAYVVAAEGAALEIAELRGALARELPDYMIPAAFVALDALPLTPNGKIDRRALPAPDLDAQIAHRYVAPRNATEKALCRIFADVLGIDRVGVDDDFFQLGGHSLLAMTLVETLRGHGLRTDVRTLFANPTPGRFALAMGDGGDVVVPPNLIPPGCGAITPDMLTLATLSQAEIDRIVAQAPGGASNIQDIYPLAPLQEGILFHHLIAQRGDPYLTPVLLAFDTGARIDAFLDALQAVVARQDILRTAIVWEGLAEPMQVVWRDATLIVEEVSLDTADGDVAEQLRRRFDPRGFRLDLRQAPMMRGFRAHDAETDRWLLLILFHHMVSDHTTLEGVVEEAHAHLLGEAGRLLAPLAFRDFVAQARLGVAREEHEAFFRSMLGDVIEPTAPFGLLDARGDGSGVGEARLALDASLARRLRARAQALGVSPASLCHQAFAQVLARAPPAATMWCSARFCSGACMAAQAPIARSASSSTRCLCAFDWARRASRRPCGARMGCSPSCCAMSTPR